MTADASALSSSAASPRTALAELFSRLVAQLLPVTYFLVTVSFYLRTYDSAQIKITLTQIGCSAVILLWFIQLVLEKRWPITRKDLPLLAPFLAVLISGIVSFVHSEFRDGSLDEFVRRVLYAFMAIIVILDFRGWDRHRRLLRWFLAAFGVVVFYGFVQYFDTRLFPAAGGPGIDPFVWRQAFGHRVFSSFGNPNFYGNFLVIITPIILSIYLRSGGKIFRPYFMIVCMVAVVYLTDRLFVGYFGGVNASSAIWVEICLIGAIIAVVGLVWWKSPSAAASGMMIFWAAMFLNLYSTETKGAWLGFTGSLITTTLLVGFFFAGQNARTITRRLLILALITGALGLSIVAYYARQRFQSVSFRVFTWIATWEMITEKPVLGTGIGSFKWAYPAYRRPEIILIEAKSNTETDHAEDEYLEVWYDEGIVGIGILVWLVATVTFLGLRTLSSLTRQLAQAPPGTKAVHGERAFSILAYLGAYWGALIHWFVDVSIRFVSSGIYSIVLPGLVVSLIKNSTMPVRQDAPSPLDRWIRSAVVVFWMAVLASLKWRPEDMPLIAVFALGTLLWCLSEALEWRLTPEYDESDAAAAPLTGEALEQDLRRLPLIRTGAILALATVWGYSFWVFRNYFLADINHNLAIFFSKNGIWTQSPEFNATLANYSPDIKQEYEKVGAALEHYQQVRRLNPNFPMAGYFIGNVYNDWGSTLHQQSLDARQKGDPVLAKTLREQALEKWDRSLKVYQEIKDFAPNYVQTHHQVGLVHLKRGELFKAWGEDKESQAAWDTALMNFDLYHNLDPVFPPNYYRTAYIHYSRGEFAKAEETYKEALVYNSKNVVQRYFPDRNVETYMNLARLAYVQWTNKYPNLPTLPTTEEFDKALANYQAAVDESDKLVDPERTRWKTEAMKGLAIVNARVGRQGQAVEWWQKIRAINPQDPDVKNIFKPAPAS